MRVQPWVRRGGPAVLAVALLLYLMAYARWPAMLVQVDLQVYRFGAMRARDGLDLYSAGLTGNPKTLLFIYPPFAALALRPLAYVAEPLVQVLWLASMCGLLTYAIRRMLTAMGLAVSQGLWSLTALLLGLVLWLEPVRLSLQLGQINVVILTLVLADLLADTQRKSAGVGIGLAAAIKLTPALLIVYLVAIGRLRAALVAGATLAATIVVGFVLLPADSAFYWLRGGFHDVSRISVDPLANTGVGGLLTRLHAPAALATAGAVVVAVAAVTLAAASYRRGQRVLALAIVGMACAAASPFSWSHHWVWFAPLTVHLRRRRRLVGAITGCGSHR
ncbi:glycosyltransferase 87 family protein [Mycobacterium sp.]|uniref:glycosyltransferase 87 family protein n=1 Tax=Mycobacterium sp. TaxID=1785 RepID=UPI0025DFF3D7|nr:glycosyltransferase 87 family protein [Mycobacterium sp.]